MDALFPEEQSLVREGKCPFCGKKVDPTTKFKDALSLREYGISGLCQNCQDKMFPQYEVQEGY
jgi:uncharacterized CHY-type Zn-finger protein